VSETGVTFTEHDALNLIADCDIGKRFVPNPLNFGDASWEWDSGFLAMGLAAYDPDRAKLELLNLMESQHSNGMVPHMVFRGDMPEATNKGLRMWGRSGGRMPEDLQTSGITQPPVIATATRVVAEHLPEKERGEFLALMFGKLVGYHSWFLRERDPDNDGVVSIIHPWESGMDNARTMLAGVHPNLLDKVIGKATNRYRNDVKAGLDSSLRTSPATHVAVRGLLSNIRRQDYDLQTILAGRPKYGIDSVLVNNVLLKGTKDLQWIAGELGDELPDTLTHYVSRGEEIMGQFWDPVDKRFYDRQTATQDLIKIPAVSNIIPMMNPTSLTQEQRDRVVSLQQDEQEFGAPFLVPTLARSAEDFHPLGYWSGPMWAWINRFQYYGAREANENALASKLRGSVIGCVSTHGAFEHFSPITGEPGGARQFAPTAGTFLELTAVS
jgi:hypothetical protein